MRIYFIGSYLVILTKIIIGFSFLLFFEFSNSQTVSEAVTDKTTDSSSSPGAGVSGLSGFFQKIGSAVKTVVGPQAATGGAASEAKKTVPLIQNLKTGVYQKSPEAIGEQRDLEESRITRGLIPIPTFTKYANGVLEKLKMSSGVSEIPGQVFVVANEQLDAAATADGHIFISSGYIKELKNEDQLAALLAHELSHILLRHHDSNAVGRTQRQVASWTNVGMSLFNSLGSLNGGSNSSVPLSEKQTSTLKRMEVLIAINDVALGPAWGRSQESEADRLGMDLLIKAGYSYNEGMISWLEIVAKWDAIQAAKRVEAEKRHQQTMESLASKGQIDSLIKGGVDFAVSDVLTKISASHDHGDARLNDLDDYFITAYNEKVPTLAAKVVSFNGEKNNPTVQAVLMDYGKVFEARSHISERNYTSAHEILKSLFARRTPIEAHALPNQLMFEVLRNLGRKNEAEAYLSKSLQSDNPVWSVYDSAAVYFLDQGNTNAIIQTGQSAFARFSGAPSAYPKLVSLYKQTGLSANMNAVLSECVLKQPDRRDQCIAASK